MRTKYLAALFATLVAGMAVMSTGCFTTLGPTLGIFSIPLPVSPYWQKLQEDKHHISERYSRVPILGPLTQGGPVTALDRSVAVSPRSQSARRHALKPSNVTVPYGGPMVVD